MRRAANELFLSRTSLTVLSEMCFALVMSFSSCSSCAFSLFFFLGRVFKAVDNSAQLQKYTCQCNEAMQNNQVCTQKPTRRQWNAQRTENKRRNERKAVVFRMWEHRTDRAEHTHVTSCQCVSAQVGEAAPGESRCLVRLTPYFSKAVTDVAHSYTVRHRRKMLSHPSLTVARAQNTREIRFSCVCVFRQVVFVALTRTAASPKTHFTQLIITRERNPSDDARFVLAFNAFMDANCHFCCLHSISSTFFLLSFHPLFYFRDNVPSEHCRQRSISAP